MTAINKKTIITDGVTQYYYVDTPGLQYTRHTVSLMPINNDGSLNSSYDAIKPVLTASQVPPLAINNYQNIYLALTQTNVGTSYGSKNYPVIYQINGCFSSFAINLGNPSIKCKIIVISSSPKPIIIKDFSPIKHNSTIDASAFANCANLSLSTYGIVNGKIITYYGGRLDARIYNVNNGIKTSDLQYTNGGGKIYISNVIWNIVNFKNEKLSIYNPSYPIELIYLRLIGY